MNHADFSTWLRHHVGAFPAMVEWFRKLPNRDDVQAAWERILADVALADAIRASDEMARGDVDEPKGFGYHAREIRAAARGISAKRFKQHTPRTVDGQPTYACRDCEDSGTLYVFHPTSMREQEDGSLEREYLLHIRRGLPVICDCEAGKLIKSEFPPRLNRKCMVPMSGSIDEMFNRLEKFIDEWNVKRTESAATYSPELAEWSR